MRIYIPLEPADLQSDISPRLVHGVTPQLKSAVPHEDAEGWEMIATLAAADDSFRRLRDAVQQLGDAANPLRRMLCVAEVADTVVAPADQLPTALTLSEPVSWDDVETILIDEPGYDDLIQRALDGDEQAFIASGDIDLLWYDVVERSDLAAELR
ncbi:DUF6912 family protein [Trueperella bialowiezensis]|uniref:Uncharacterized protein n=1 Tax=Trueperella bialowiezensis TaxID=312285 RepID=A0A448PFM3_9ACTO|nr:hypothetical protein [Trueperella bialowiezensis]VEI13720.1 Uncharacterised protein [Trueperella bialowiezensis]